MDQRIKVSSGLPGLDQVIDSLRLGDNVVLQVDNIHDYEIFVQPFVHTSLEAGRKLIYMRFARHYPIIDEQENITIYNIDAEHGFEAFSTQVHDIITKEGEGAFYVFDCLSDLLYTWATDLMIGNFFEITCPYLYRLNTVAYFAIYKNMNSYETISSIRETTQVLINIYQVKRQIYVHPVKVIGRYSPTMFLPHIKQNQDFIPLTNSADASRLFADMSLNIFDGSRRYLDYWDRMFLKASDSYEKKRLGKLSAVEERTLVGKLCRTILTKDERFLEILTDFFSLEDILYIKSSLVGSGYVGGKALGMLLARKVLLKDPDCDYSKILEPHDSFYIGSDVFYTYLVKNGLWNLRMAQRKPENYFSLACELKQRMLNGVFPDNIKNHFLRILEYFGQSPIIVRSSSLLEDGFGNSFAGKYESVFCVNQGTLEERYLEFEKAVKLVYASTMNDDALSYRLKWGLADQDEQMALLVQRVSGSYRGQYFFPDLAGVGYSQNIYVWDKHMSPQAGMLRMVVGLGTRAVNRTEGDYARIIALDEPLSLPLAEDKIRHTQHNIDVLDIPNNRMTSVAFNDLAAGQSDLKLCYFGQRHYDTEARLKENGMAKQYWVVDFENFLTSTTFTDFMRKMLKTLEQVYAYPVDIEFTVNFKDRENYQINLLQCRPLQTKGMKSKVQFPKHIEFKNIFFQCYNTFMGGNISYGLNRVIYVEPEAYSKLCDQDKYRVARSIGQLNRMIKKERMSVLLLGPGRWGTCTPSLGVPVSFSEINNVAVLGEIAYSKAGYSPEVSYGTHFFQDLIESGIFYVALFPGKRGIFQTEELEKQENLLPKILPDEASLQDTVKVYDISRDASKALHIIADIEKQKAVCFFKRQ